MPDDPKIEEMDPILKVWMFENWVEDQKDEVDLAKNHAYLVGSFWNPDAVKKLTGEGSNTFVSDDEAFEKSTEIVTRAREAGKKKRRRRKIRE